MSKIQEKIFNDMATKLGLSQNDRLISKSIEILELIKAKNSEILKHLNENSKIILCLDISSELLNIPFSEENFIALYACVKKSEYLKNKKIIQKVLDLNKKTTIDDVIRKLCITQSHVQNTAKEILMQYIKQHTFDHQQEIDPSEIVMSVYFACKFENVRALKKNVLNLSNLTHSQWIVMEKSWEKWTVGFGKKIKDCKKEASNKEIKAEMEEGKHETNVKNMEVTEESYDAWAKRILEKARSQLRKNK